MKKVFLLLLLAFLPIAPVKAQTINEKVFEPCIRKSLLNRGAPKKIDKAFISSSYRFEGQDYYMIDLLATEGYGWSIVAIIEDGTCKKVGDGFVNDGEFVSLPPKLQLAWTEKLMLKRIEEVGRETIKQQIKDYTGPFQPYEIKVFEKLGLLD